MPVEFASGSLQLRLNNDIDSGSPSILSLSEPRSFAKPVKCGGTDLTVQFHNSIPTSAGAGFRLRLYPQDDEDNGR